MAFKQSTDADALALEGTTDTDGLQYPTLNDSNWGAEVLRALAYYKQLFSKNLAVLEIEDNADAIGVLPGYAILNGELLTFTPSVVGDAEVDGMADEDTTYIWAYKSDDGVLSISSAVDATGWPTTAHFKLAQVTREDGVITAITDMRGTPEKTFMPALADLDQTISGTYDQAEVQAISDKLDALLQALRDNGVLASS